MSLHHHHYLDRTNFIHLSFAFFSFVTLSLLNQKNTFSYGATIYPTGTNWSSTTTPTSFPSKYSSSFSPQTCIASFLPSYFQTNWKATSKGTTPAESSSSSSSSAFPKTSLTTSMRAWTCHGRTHREMIDRLCSAGIIQSPLVKEALLRVDRIHYVINQEYAYMDAPQQMYDFFVFIFFIF